MKDISQYGDGTKVMCYISVCLWGGGQGGGVLSRNHEGLFEISRITKKIISFSRFL